MFKTSQKRRQQESLKQATVPTPASDVDYQSSLKNADDNESLGLIETTGNENNQEEEEAQSPCEICGQLLGVSKLQKHIQYHHGANANNKHKCDECGRIFNRRDRLRDHRLATHVKRELKCVHCAKIFYNRQVLNMHVKGVHDKVRHQCHLCDRSYMMQGDLKTHIRGFHEGKLSTCSVCGKEFIRNAEKNRHERQIHNLLQK